MRWSGRGASKKKPHDRKETLECIAWFGWSQGGRIHSTDLELFKTVLTMEKLGMVEVGAELELTKHSS